MGRPLNKKYFGNTNMVPPSGAEIGGEGVASVNVTTVGNYNGTLPTVSFGTPSFPEGEAAAGIVHGGAVQAYDFVAFGTGYQLGDTLTVVGGTSTSSATLTVTGVQTVGTPTLTAAGTAYDVSGGAHDEIWFDSAGWYQALKIRVETVTGGNGVATFTVIQQGVWIGPGAAPTSVTGTSTHNGPLDNNGNGATFTLTWGAWGANVANTGNYTAVPANPAATTGAGNNAATVDMRWGVVNGVEMTTNGSGYISVADAVPTFTAASGTGTQTAIGVAVLTNTYQNAIVGVDIATGKVVDIVRQESNNSYHVMGDEPYPYVLTLASPSDSIGLYIQATDSSGKSYWVKKIMAHKVVLGEVTGGGEFGEDNIVLWSFDAPVENVSVTIRNAA